MFFSTLCTLDCQSSWCSWWYSSINVMPCLLLCADVLTVSGSCCVKLLNRVQWKRLDLALYSARDVQIYCTESLYFPYTWCLYVKQILINIPTAFSRRLLSLFAYRVVRMRMLALSDAFGHCCQGRVEALPRKWQTTSSGLESKGKLSHVWQTSKY